ncbi:MAG TPA: molybdopterin-dependent oxidoreductase [Actinomycetota bacterium]
MAGRRTNLALLALLALALATGGLAFAIGTTWNRWIVLAHGVAGLALLALAPWKSAVARRGLRRARRDSWASVLLTVLVAVAILFGVLHAVGIVSVGPLTSMQLHVGAALGSVPFAIWHVVARSVRPRRTDLTRRNLVRAGAVVGAGGLAYAAIEGSVRIASLPGRDRRFTGSHETGSFDPEAMPVTQWLNDSVPEIDADSWRLVVRAGDREDAWSYEELTAFGDRLRATLDCTGGWFAVQDWEGVRLSRLLPEGEEGRSIHVASATGYGRRFPLQDADHLLLAMRVGAEPLSAGHGFPARIVAPGRRGFWWVKWVTRIELSPIPWWWQPPFPLA